MDGAATRLDAESGLAVTTLSLFNFEGLRKLWILAQMGLSHGPMRATQPGIPAPEFYKLVGSGTGIGFNPKPNWGRYGILATWPSEVAARAAFELHPVYQRWRDASSGGEHFILSTTRAWGSWGGEEPFKAVPKEALKPVDKPILGVLSRASLKLPILRAFWKRVPDVSRQLENSEGVLFTIGIGEIPWKHQITFSLWDSHQAIHQFAREKGAHATAIEASQQGKWFKDVLFARFQLIDRVGF